MAVFLTAEWRALLMLNYEVEPRSLARLVPHGTELDFWNDRTYISVVGFRFEKTRVMGLRVPGHENFEEVNLRFYVRRKCDDGWRRGVVFVREIVPRRAIAFVARRLYKEPYVAAPMRHVDAEIGTADAPQRRISYSWRLAGRWNTLAAVAVGPSALPPSGSEAEFIAEHYWGYTACADGSSREYQVTHEPWQVQAADSPQLDCDVGAVYGPRYIDTLSAAPSSAFVAMGSPITVHR